MSSGFARFSIQAKLTAGLGSLLVAVAGLGLFVLLRMSAMNDAAEVMTSNYFPSLLGSSEMKSTLLRFRIKENRLLLIKSGEKARAVLKELTSLRAHFARQRKDYDEFLDAGEETDLIKEIDKTWLRYLAMHDQMVGTFVNHQIDEAADFLVGDTNRPSA